MNDKKVSDYHITSDVLGKGSFSTVYLGYTAQKERVAVKVIPRQKIKETQVRFFVNEINLLKKCKSPHIVKFIDLQKSKVNYYIVLQYCDQGSLEEYIKKHERLPQKEAMNIFVQLVKGMNAMKKLDIIHRDIKPANIMFSEGKVKYVDFGLATKFYDKGELMKTFAGSPFNMAPQILHGRPYDDKVDIYSLGTVLYQMLFGVRPFSGSNIEQLIANIEGRRFMNPKDRVKLSKSIKELLKKLLEPKPEKRLTYSQLVQLVASYEKEYLESVVNKYKEMYDQSRKYCFMFGGLAAPLLGMHYPMGMGLWERNLTKSIESQVQLNMKGIFQDFKCGKKLRKNPWDMDLRLCCSLYRSFLNPQKANSISIQHS